MKQWIVISLAVILLLAATVRYFQKISDKIDNEMQLYVHNLNYNFTARVDSVVLINKNGVGNLFCQVISGKYNKFVEDSLNQHLTNYKRIRFLFFRPNGQFLIFTRNADKYQTMDSISVNSNEDRFRISRKGRNILEAKLSDATIHKVNFAFWLKD